MHHVPTKARKGIGSPGTGVTLGESSSWCWESNPTPLQELSTSAPPPQPRHTHTHFLTLTEKTSDPLLSPGAGLVPLGLHRSAPPSPFSRIPAIHQRATEAPMQKQTGEKEDGASRADPDSRHPAGPGGEGRQTPKPRLGR